MADQEFPASEAETDGSGTEWLKEALVQNMFKTLTMPDPV
jgi:hypothetical protein